MIMNIFDEMLLKQQLASVTNTLVVKTPKGDIYLDDAVLIKIIKRMIEEHTDLKK